MILSRSRGDGLVTYECFGTTLTRAVSSPEAVFVLLGQRLAVRPSAESFARSRTRAAQVAAERLGVGHTLRDVYEELVWATGLELPVDHLVEAELALERELSRPRRGVVDALRTTEQPVAFLADSALPSSFLADVLDVHGLRRGAPVLVSHELGASKALGSAYGVVARRLGVPTRSWTHHGHDPVGDVRNARLAGVRAVPHGAEALTRYEQLLDDRLFATGGASALLAAAGRASRTGAPQECPKQDVAAGVIGPLLSAYLLWCVEQARGAGCTRLYFCARDGQALHRMASVLQPVLAPEMELRYLLGSREAWLVDTDDPLAGELDHVTVTGTGDRLAQVGAYFRSVGLLDDEPFALVDMASRGNVGRLLTDVLHRLGSRPPRLELYFAKASAEGQGAGSLRDVRGWLYDDGRQRGRRQLGIDEYVGLEMFTTADHGKVVGYGTDGRPRLRPVDGGLEQWDFGPVRQALERYAEHLRDVVPLLPSGVDLRPAVWDAFLLFWQAPTAGEVATWGRFPFEGDDGSTRRPATALPAREVLGHVLRLDVDWRPRGSWPAGARAVSTPAARAGVTIADGLRGQRARAKRLLTTLAARRAPVAVRPGQNASGDELITRRQGRHRP